MNVTPIIDDTDSELLEIHHNLQAQIINNAGLKREIEKSIVSIKELIDAEQQKLSTEFFTQLTELIDLDLLPSLEFQNQTAQNANKLVNKTQLYLETKMKVRNLAHPERDRHHSTLE